MNSLIVYLIIFLITIFFESVLYSAGLFSILPIIMLLFFECNKNYVGLIFICVISLVVDSFFFNCLGTIYFSFLIMLIVHSAGKKLLPYDDTIVKIPVLIASFAVFHISVLFFIKSFGLGTASSLNLLSIILQSFVEALVYCLLHSIQDKFYNRESKFGSLKL